MHELFEQNIDLFSALTLIERDSSGRERYALESGKYGCTLGFREFGVHESDWASGSSDDHGDRLTPFKFDYKHPSVSQFEEVLFRGENEYEGVDDLRVVIARFEKLIASLDVSDSEYNTSLSDIVSSGRGMCAAQVTLFGSMLARNTDYEIQAISGVVGIIESDDSSSFDHQWMRIASDGFVCLYDPMYRKFAAYEHEDSQFYTADTDDDYDHFDTLNPKCDGILSVLYSLNVTAVGGCVHRIDNADTGYTSIYAKPSECLKVQLLNEMPFVFQIDQAEQLDIHSNAIQMKHAPVASYFPVKNIQKL